MTWGDLLVAGYATVYVVVVIGGLRIDLGEKTPGLIVALEITVAILALVGYGAFHLGYRGERLSDVWKIVAPALVVTEAALAVRDLRGLRPIPDFSTSESVWVPTVGAWLGILVPVPAYWFNLRLAYGW